MLEALEIWEMLTFHFPPASRSRCLYLRLDPKTNLNQPRPIARAFSGGSEAADHYC